MATQRARPQDYTGRQRDKLAAEHAEVVRARDDQIAMATAVQAEVDSGLHDYVGDQQTTQLNADGEVVYVEAPARVIRVNSDIDEMTFGAGNLFTFKEGQQYRVSAELANYLEELGRVWH